MSSPQDAAHACDERRLTAYVRATVSTADDRECLRYLEAVVATEPPPTWTATTWSYPALRFLAGTVPGPHFATWLAQGGKVPLQGEQAELPALQGSGASERLPSLYRHADVRLPWPTQRWSLYLESFTSNEPEWRPGGFMVGPSAPTFAHFDLAHRAFYTGNYSSVGPSTSRPSEFARIWVLSSDAWIRRVTLGVDYVRVQIKGTVAAGTRIDLVGEAGLVTKAVGRSGTVQLRQTSSLGREAWLYLVHDDTCLDYRLLGDYHNAEHELAQQGISVALPDDPDLGLMSLVGQTESDCLEYKRELPEQDKADRVMKTVAAFATGRGGHIIFGVDRDEITVVGHNVKDSHAARDRLYQLVRDWVFPAPEVTVEELDYAGKLLLVLVVPPGSTPPYSLGNQPPKYYIRRGTHSVPARPEELREAVLDR